MSWRNLGDKVRNWGRWGPDDQRGTLNHITPEALRRAAGTVRSGRTVSLSAPISADGPQGAHGIRRNPVHLMQVDGADSDIAGRLGSWGGRSAAEVGGLFGAGSLRFNDDYLIMPTQAATQWDALAHVYYDGELYNGVPASAVTSLGAVRNGIDAVADAGGVCARGVLLDVARHRGVPHLDPNQTIDPAELDAVAAAQGVTIGTGDVVVVRTGWWPVFRDGRATPDEWLAQTPGLSWECAEWLHEHEIAAVAADNVCVEAMVPVEGEMLVLHMLALRDMGLTLGEIWDLEAIGADCAEDGRYEFLLCAPALSITGAVGSPINPVAMK
ncbi:cyclase family protein [Pseudonocardia pini]|uniref:cyclase family protein n=1 Tax=Pseudonocardia pini TaxID=2758030 RepID=UPI0015EFE5B0|nr:cyclase family protein [Pseudonocardia pini]